MDFILVACMVVMFLLIFINVMMRFIFNDSIDIAEELPRFLFVWMTFIGAVIALREKNTYQCKHHYCKVISFGKNDVLGHLSDNNNNLCWIYVLQYVTAA
ncbi:hypothetical protein CRG93_04770 [Escherichia sp. E2593]|uniref:TRAP transporter small permease n=1 Tax=Escherichia sp. E2593 TaxID=2044458 RepID=UPI00107F655E|nr:hypothetical protein CRG93_04770 [Escherichia sp. E2593]